MLKFINLQGLTKTGDDYEVKAAHVELAERMRKVCNIDLIYFNMLVSTPVKEMLVSVLEKEMNFSIFSFMFFRCLQFPIA